MRILSVSSSRADIGILTPVWDVLAQQNGVELHVMMTGMHMRRDAVEISVPRGAIRHRLGEDIGGGDSHQAALGMAAAMKAAADLLGRVDFDCILLAGDRLDMLPTACAALPFNIPLAHLHGGELTYGAVDDRVRHAISKMAHVHFASSVDAARRLAAMGEETWRIHVTGGPGLDTLRLAPVLTKAELAAQLGPSFAGSFLVVTVHPETNASDPAAAMTATLSALDRLGMPVVITAPNSDPGGRNLQALVEAFVDTRGWAVFRPSLGTALYPSVLRHAAVMVGNSSSGLIEAGYFGLPVVNVGARQDGRPAGPNVTTVASDAGVVLAAVQAALKAQRYPAFSPYGDGHASQRIAGILTSLPARDALLYKRFGVPAAGFDFTAPWASQ